jgi:large subunit ribosomal protein L40e
LLGEDMVGSEAKSADKMETTVEARNTVGESDQWQHPITGTRTRVQANLGIDPWKCNCCGTWNPKESGACSNAIQWQGSNRNAMQKKKVTSLWMTIYVRSALSAKTMTLNVLASDTIGDLKHKIQCKKGIPHDLQQLFLNGEKLENEKSVSDYNIQKESVIRMDRLDGP